MGSPLKHQETLEALKKTPKGCLKYNQDYIRNEVKDICKPGPIRQWAAVSQNFSKTPGRLSGHDVQSILDSKRLITVNTLHHDETFSDEPSPRKQYFLDEENSDCSLLKTSTSSETLDSSPEQKVQESLSSSSVEEVAVRQLDTVYNIKLQDRIAESQAAYLKSLSEIDDEFRQRFQRLELSQEFEDMRRMEKIEDEFELSERSFQGTLDALKRLHMEEQRALNSSLEEVQEQTKRALERRAMEEQSAKKREEERKREIQSRCEGMLTEIDRQEEFLLTILNCETFSEMPVAGQFVNKANEIVMEIRGKVNNWMVKPSVVTLARLKECLEALHTLTGRVEKQLERMEQLKSQQEQEQQRLRQQEQESLRQMEEEKLRQQEEEKLRQQEKEKMHHLAQQRRPPTHTQQPPPQYHSSNEPQSILTAKPLSDMCCHEDTFLEFMRLNDVIRVAQEAGKQLSNNPQYKKLRMELQKAVSITINAISALSGHHIKEKLRTLGSLSRGERVSVGNSSVSAEGIPLAVLFCKNLIAKKLVEQADSQVSSNAKAAFPFAAVMVSLMNESTDMKDLILGYFYIQCPYLVPYYPPKQEGQSTEEYFSQLGYKINEANEIEAQDLFIKRMTGYTKLLASCMTSQAVGGIPNQSVDMACAWMLLVRLVNLRPQPATTATILSSLLSVCGCRLLLLYGPQARKLLHFLLSQFLPVIQEATNAAEIEGDGGAIVRLEQTVVELMKRRTLQDPEGYLTRSFWYS